MRRVSPTESPPNFSSTASASTRATIASATMPAAGTAQTSERWWWATVASPVATSTVRSARGTVAIGFIAARTRSASPVDMPPSVPPDRPDVRRIPSSAVTISSWAWEPGVGRQREAVADLDALDRLDAHQRAGEPRVEPTVPVHVRAETRRQAVHDDLDHAAEGVAVLVRLVDLRLTIAALASASRQRTGSASSAADVGGERDGSAGRLRGADGHDVGDHAPLRRPARGTCAATAPSATRAAVSRAEARSRIGRASSKSYFCMPTRSAWPGRGRVSAALRASASSSASSTGSADMTFSHFGHSVLPMRIATGLPRVRPCRRPPMTSTSSCSNFIRAPRP